MIVKVVTFFIALLLSNNSLAAFSDQKVIFIVVDDSLSSVVSEIISDFLKKDNFFDFYVHYIHDESDCLSVETLSNPIIISKNIACFPKKIDDRLMINDLFSKWASDRMVIAFNDRYSNMLSSDEIYNYNIMFDFIVKHSKFIVPDVRSTMGSLQYNFLKGLEVDDFIEVRLPSNAIELVQKSDAFSLLLKSTMKDIEHEVVKTLDVPLTLYEPSVYYTYMNSINAPKHVVKFFSYINSSKVLSMLDKYGFGAL